MKWQSPLLRTRGCNTTTHGLPSSVFQLRSRKRLPPQRRPYKALGNPECALDLVRMQKKLIATLTNCTSLSLPTRQRSTSLTNADSSRHSSTGETSLGILVQVIAPIVGKRNMGQLGIMRLCVASYVSGV